MYLHALQLQQVQEAGLLGDPRIVRRKDPGRRTFFSGFLHGASALQIEVVQELLAVAGQIVHAKQDGALLHVDVVAGRPFDLGQGRIGPVPLAVGVGGRQRAYARVCPAVAKRLIKPADGIMVIGDG